MEHLPQIITSLLDNDLYKLTMLQTNLHQFGDANVEWTYKNRDPNCHFTKEMIDEINYQIDLYCTLRFTKPELDWVRNIRYVKPDTVNYLRLYQPRREDITCEFDTETLQPVIHFYGPNTQVSWHEVPVMAIVSEVYFKLHYTPEEQSKAILEAKRRFEEKLHDLITGKRRIGSFSEFGTRRRADKELQDYIVYNLSTWQFFGSKFVGTSNMYLAMKYGLTPCGTMAHEEIELVGQGYPWHNPAYSNKYMMEAWIKEYDTDNGIYLTDCVTTDCFLLDFTKSFAKQFSGVRHDSGDPVEWGEKILAHYEKLGIDARQKTLLFSDALDFEKAEKLYQRFTGRCQVAFGIGTWLTNDTGLPPMNQVIKLTEVNGIPVCKISDTEGKFMGKDLQYKEFLQRAIAYRTSK